MSVDLGISDLEIERVINNSQNEDLKNNFVGVFNSNEMNGFFSFHSIMRKSLVRNILF